MIIIIENNRILGPALIDLLQPVSNRTVLYRTAEDATNDFDFLSDHQIKAVVSNHLLPGISGLNFIKHANLRLRNL